MTAFERAQSYLGKLPVAVAGSGGHAATFRAACALVEFGLTSDEAWPLLVEWNTLCQPPWGEADLQHKLADAFRRTKPRPEFMQRSRPHSPSATWRDSAKPRGIGDASIESELPIYTKWGRSDRTQGQVSNLKYKFRPHPNPPP